MRCTSDGQLHNASSRGGTPTVDAQKRCAAPVFFYRGNERSAIGSDSTPKLSRRCAGAAPHVCAVVLHTDIAFEQSKSTTHAPPSATVPTIAVSHAAG